MKWIIRIGVILERNYFEDRSIGDLFRRIERVCVLIMTMICWQREAEDIKFRVKLLQKLQMESDLSERIKWDL